MISIFKDWELSKAYTLEDSDLGVSFRLLPTKMPKDNQKNYLAPLPPQCYRTALIP